jgi:hypothetical protein
MNFQNFEKKLNELVSTRNPSQTALKIETLFGNKTVFEHNAKQKKYPASLVKLFWAVLAVERSFDLQNESILRSMLEDSSDQAGQKVVDFLCGDFNERNFELRLEIRKKQLYQPWINEGFVDLNITHKTFLEDYDEFDGKIKREISENHLTAEEMNLFWRKLMTNSFESFTIKDNQQKKLLDFLHRTPLKEPLEPETKHFQSTLLCYEIPKNIQAFSKAGWRDKTLNDCGVYQIDDNEYLIISALTELGEKEGIKFLRDVSKIVSQLIA